MNLRLSSEQPRVVLLENIHPVAKENLEQRGFYVECHPASYSGPDLIEKVKDFDLVGIRSKTKMTGEVLSQLPRLQGVAAFCIGTNQIDLDYTKQKGLPVFNAPYSNTRSVAELVISEMIALSRRLTHISYLAHQGIWQKSAQNSYEVRGKRLGIVGYGHIGSQLSVLAESLGLEVYYYDVIKKLPLGNAKPLSSLEELMQTCDFVSFHVPETPETKNMISEKELSWMKEGAYLINASRGTVIVIEDLVKVLKNKKLAGAAVDVFPEEPANNQLPFSSGLQNLENVILTPHIGGSTAEAQHSIGREVAESIFNFFERGQTEGAVAFPQVALKSAVKGCRLINAHQNRPGVLGAINSVVSEQGLNISNQWLSTNDQVGYLVLDVEGDDLSELAQKVSAMDVSLWTRVL